MRRWCLRLMECIDYRHRDDDALVMHLLNLCLPAIAPVVRLAVVVPPTILAAEIILQKCSSRNSEEFVHVGVSSHATVSLLTIKTEQDRKRIRPFTTPSSHIHRNQRVAKTVNRSSHRVHFLGRLFNQDYTVRR